MSPDVNSDTSPRWSVERRLAFIEQRLIWDGRINRLDLVTRFGVSPNQATADLKRFEAAHPGALAYDTRARTYRAGPGLHAPSTEDGRSLLRELRLIAEGVMPIEEGTLSAPPPLALAEAPLRQVPEVVLAAVITAIRDRREIEAVYQSFSTPAPRRRRIAPHALVFDGFRWHARARDIEEDRFKDFVLGRLTQIAIRGAASSNPADDVEWHNRVELIIAPHPGLSAHQRAVIAADYGMIQERLLLPIRQAVVYYVKRRLGLLPGHERLAPNDQQIVLIDERVVGSP